MIRPTRKLFFEKPLSAGQITRKKAVKRRKRGQTGSLKAGNEKPEKPCEAMSRFFLAVRLLSCGAARWDSHRPL